MGRAYLDARNEKREAALDEGGTHNGRDFRDVIAAVQEARGDPPDRQGIRLRLLGGHARGDHGDGGHGRVGAVQEDHAHVEVQPNTRDAVRAVDQRRAKRRRLRKNKAVAHGLEVLTERLRECAEGYPDLLPLLQRLRGAVLHVYLVCCAVESWFRLVRWRAESGRNGKGSRRRYHACKHGQGLPRRTTAHRPARRPSGRTSWRASSRSKASWWPSCKASRWSSRRPSWKTSWWPSCKVSRWSSRRSSRWSSWRASRRPSWRPSWPATRTSHTKHWMILGGLPLPSQISRGKVCEPA